MHTLNQLCRCILLFYAAMHVNYFLPLKMLLLAHVSSNNFSLLNLTFRQLPRYCDVIGLLRQDQT